MTSQHRARYLTIASVLLALAGAAAAVCGVGAWMVSGCCGSSEPPQEGYLFVGALAAGGLWTTAYWCFSRPKQNPEAPSSDGPGT